MGKLTLVKAIDSYSASLQVIRDLANFCHLDQENIVIVPDKYSLITEKLIFSELNITSTLNIKVMGINRFASLLLTSANLPTKTISTNKELILLGKVVLQEKENFLFFPKEISDISFLKLLKNTISQLKTSMIYPIDLEPIIDADKKMHDIYLVYKGYENLKGTSMDLADFIDEFVKAEQCFKIDESRIYFCFFDSLTRQGLNILSMLLRRCKSVEFALVQPEENQKNKFLYDSNLYKNILDIASQQNDIVEEVETGSSNFVSNFIAKNIYLTSPKRLEIDDFLNTYECSSTSEIAQMIAKDIRYQIVNGKRYNDLVVGLSSLGEKYQIFKRVFDEYDIPAFFDKENTMNQTLLIQFIDGIISCRGVEKVSVLKNLCFNPFLNIDQEFRQNIFAFLDKYKNISLDLDVAAFQTEQDEQIYFQINELINKLQLNIENQTSACALINKIIKKLELFECEQTCKKLESYFVEIGDFEHQKIYEKIYEKTLKLLNDFIDEAGEVVDAVDNYKLLLDNVFEATKMATLPLGVDCVYVADVSNCFIESNKILYLAQANIDQMPEFQKDVGLLSDKDISRFSKYIKVDPTIRTINQRKRMKLCSTLCVPQQKINIFYSSRDSQGKEYPKATFVSCLQKMFPDCKQVDFIKTISNLKNGKKELIKYLTSGNSQNEIEFSSLYQSLKKADKNIDLITQNINYQNTIKNLNNSKELFFKNDRVSVSQMETYAKCPFGFFLKYGLKLKEENPLDFDPVTIGKIEHYVFEKYYKNHKGADTKIAVNKIFEELKDFREYKPLFAHKKFSSIIDNLKKECVITLDRQNFEQSLSKFEISEKDIENRLKNCTLKFMFTGKKLSLSGVVDRVDRHGNDFVVIDYKTGEVETSPEDVLYGNKIQAYVYSKALTNDNNRAVGALYVPVKAKIKKNAPYFEGVIIEDVVTDFDPTLKNEQKSILLRVKKKSDGSISKVGNTTISKEQFEELQNYSISLIQKNLSNIEQGYIYCSPLENACTYCKYGGICKFDILSGNKARKQKAIKRQSESSN